jgi:hypothetical protein
MLGCTRIASILTSDLALTEIAQAVQSVDRHGQDPAHEEALWPQAPFTLKKKRTARTD